MRRNKRALWVSLLTVVFVSVAALGGTIAAKWSPKLGLDLDGGLSVVYKTHRPVTQDEMNTLVSILGNRVSGYGSSGATVASQGKNEIDVSIPGATNTNQILENLGNTAQLFFRPGLCYAEPFKVAKGAKASTGALPSCSPTYALTPTNLGTASGGAERQVPPDPQFTSFRSTPANTDSKAATVLLPFSADSGQAGRIVAGPSQLSGTAISSANAELSQAGQWSVVMNLNGAGSTAWNALAKQQYHAIIAMDLDGQIISAPITNSENFNGSVQITGNFTHTEADNLATELKYGSLPVKLDRINIQTVSPTLGKASLQAGLIAGMAGLLLVMLYMLFYYRLLGLVVLSGLLVTSALLWAIISMMGQNGTTMDLAGIIGIIVSVGITVDSYIVYFERLKDETRSGRTVRTSVDRGFKSAFRTVLAADAVSLLGAVILYYVSIGTVKGFALFLGLSTLLDILVTYFFTRPFVILLGQHEGAAEGGRGMSVARGLGVSAEATR